MHSSSRSARPLGRSVGLLALTATVVVGAGCGPFGYLKKVAVEADRAVTRAEVEGAEEHAPYEYWGSVAYLEQSKVMMGYSEYTRSFDYGSRAKQLAEEAERKTKRRIEGKDRETAEGIAAPDELPPPPTMGESEAVPAEPVPSSDDAGDTDGKGKGKGAKKGGSK